MKCRIVCILLLPFIVLAQTNINGSRVIEGDLTVNSTLTANGITKTVQVTENLPGTCSTDQVAIRTSDGTLHFCSSLNTWAQIGGGSAGSSVMAEEVYLMAGWRNGAYYENASPWQAEAAIASPTVIRAGDGRLAGVQFEEAAIDDAVFHQRLPSTWTGAVSTAITLHWYGADNNSLSTVWQLETHCSSETENLGMVPWTWTDEGTVADENIRYAWNPVTFGSLALTGCEPGELLSVRVKRLGADVGDTYSSNVTLVDAMLKYERNSGQ